MELPSNLLEQRAFITTPKIEEHMLIVMDKKIHEEHLHQPLQTNSKQFKIAINFLSGYNGFFNVTEKNDIFYSLRSINDDDFTVISILPGAYEIESLNDEIKRVIIDKGFFYRKYFSV